MSRICLDTSAYSHFKRGEKEAVDLIAAARWVGVPVVVVGELRTGFLLGDRPQQNDGELKAFLASPVAAALDVDQEAADIYAEMMVALRRAGTPLPLNDVWIAAVAAREGVPVVTYDQHFSLIARVGVRLLGRT